MIELMAEGISLRFDPRIGQIVDFTVTDGGQSISPLHKAPWVDSEEEFPDGVPPHLKTLGGTSFVRPSVRKPKICRFMAGRLTQSGS